MSNNLMNVPKSALIITGLIGSGKTTAALWLNSLGFNIVSAGNVVREMCAADSLATDRKMLQTYGENLLKQKGAAYFSDLLISRAGDFESVVFEGIRSVEVVKEIKKK